MKQSSFSSSSSSRNSTSLTNRLKTIFKKAEELSILCAIDVCVIYYGPDGELRTWPKERNTVKDMASRYKEATKRKKKRTLSTLQERLRIVESQKQQNKNLVHQSLTPSYLNQIQHLNPSNFSPYMYNHGDAATLSQLPLSASLSNQLQLPESLDAAWFWSEHVFGQHHQQQQLSTSWRVKHTRILTVSFGTSICSE
ncbi:putative transcription factor MADS-type1 family [Arabidopsis thaliana]|uniref:AGAMOUS-like 51 n=3 Tax=Arabidopsis TaxID=3701 RepID=O81421_ARATH|nr:AGAMOUS-like 51 [Arabidopsis thaliana]KAG7614854.1 Transcription factor MADS-box superfamily [Arabidopsis thaliana x Arabidopsis arenosa]AAC28182.1 T2H3.15 [Arabidopsis thaliana]AAN52779.1 MADS-box protein AGL51 [Arabidopsis thaliana]AEE82144.1 AGAMOUS-like 51 [Arabidopsis thaliana]OAO98799.1 AGL51 [Arabidopsis thaliana]|eukprot:NP_974500.1 AGAMOUS-like 51 [Arabidopsis thaliana]